MPKFIVTLTCSSQDALAAVLSVVDADAECISVFSDQPSALPERTSLRDLFEEQENLLAEAAAATSAPAQANPIAPQATEATRKSSKGWTRFVRKDRKQVTDVVLETVCKNAP